MHPYEHIPVVQLHEHLLVQDDTDTDAIRGRWIQATHPIKASHILMQVPKSACLATPESLSDDLKALLKKLAAAGVSPLHQTATVLLRELHLGTSDSLWGTHRACLPALVYNVYEFPGMCRGPGKAGCTSVPLGTPTTFDNPNPKYTEEIAHVQAGTSQEGAVASAQQGLRKTWERDILPALTAAQWPADCLALPAFTRAVELTASRSFDVEDSYLPVLVPAVDLCNHAVSSPCTTLACEGDAFVYRAARDIAAGEEVTTTYGDLSDAALFHTYGFVPHTPSTGPAGIHRAVQGVHNPHTVARLPADAVLRAAELMEQGNAQLAAAVGQSESTLGDRMRLLQHKIALLKAAGVWSDAGWHVSCSLGLPSELATCLAVLGLDEPSWWVMRSQMEYLERDDDGSWVIANVVPAVVPNDESGTAGAGAAAAPPAGGDDSDSAYDSEAEDEDAARAAARAKSEALTIEQRVRRGELRVQLPPISMASPWAAKQPVVAAPASGTTVQVAATAGKQLSAAAAAATAAAAAPTAASFSVSIPSNLMASSATAQAAVDSDDDSSYDSASDMTPSELAQAAGADDTIADDNAYLLLSAAAEMAAEELFAEPEVSKIAAHVHKRFAGQPQQEAATRMVATAGELVAQERAILTALAEVSAALVDTLQAVDSDEESAAGSEEDDSEHSDSAASEDQDGAEQDTVQAAKPAPLAAAIADAFQAAPAPAAKPDAGIDFDAPLPSKAGAKRRRDQWKRK